MNIRTVLFDLDGTLLNTNELIHQSFKHTFNHFKLNFTDEEIIEFNGPPLLDTFQRINAQLADDMVAVYKEHNHSVHDQYVSVFPNVIDTLEELSNRSIKMGVVTTKMRPGVELGLELTGLADYFDTIVTLDDVENAKPHPEPVLKAMKALSAEKDSTIMVGDSFQDIKAGQNAGVRTAGVAWSLKGKERLLNYEPTMMLDEMSDLLRYCGSVVDAKN